MIPQHVFVGEKEATLITLYWSPSRHFYTCCRIWIRVYIVEVGAGPVKSKRTVKKMCNTVIFLFDFAVLRIRIRIHRIHTFLGLLDPNPDPLVRGMDPDLDPSIIMQK
jgi:hypothetical protein